MHFMILFFIFKLTDATENGKYTELLFTAKQVGISEKMGLTSQFCKNCRRD